MEYVCQNGYDCFLGSKNEEGNLFDFEQWENLARKHLQHSQSITWFKTSELLGVNDNGVLHPRVDLDKHVQFLIGRT